LEDEAGLEEHRIPWKGRGKLRLAYSIPKTNNPTRPPSFWLQPAGEE